MRVVHVLAASLLTVGAVQLRSSIARAPSAPPELRAAPVIRDESFRDEGGRLFRHDQPFTGALADFDSTGRIERESEYRDGRLHGVARAWYPGGHLRSVRYYANGLEDGIHHGWYASGRPRFRYAYAAGMPEGESLEWYESGQIFTRFHYEKGQERGSQQMWTEEGLLRANYVVEKGRRFGLMGAAGCRGVDTDSAKSQ